MFLPVLDRLHSASNGTDADCLTSTKSVKAIVAREDGSFLVATSGGLLIRDTQGRWTKRTIAQGLPSNELEAVARVSGRDALKARSSWYVEREGRWEPLDKAPTVSKVKADVSVDWAKGVRKEGRPFSPPLPPEAVGPTSTAATKTVRLVGTSSQGVFELQNGRWKRVAFDEPPGSSVQALTIFQGHLVVSTLQEGLGMYGPDGWTKSNQGPRAPRESVVFDGELYVRSADGRVARKRGDVWTLDALTRSLPRKEARFLAGDAKAHTLFVAQWAGWSTFHDGTWSHRLQDNGLEGCATTCLLPDGDDLWIGTQGRGLARIRGKSTEWFDERKGLMDDWITCLARAKDAVWVGTFVGGLIKVDEDGTVGQVAGTSGENVTCLKEIHGSVVFGTRTGLYRVTPQGAERVSTPFPVLEVQALAVDKNVVWIGTRTGLVRLPLASLGSF